MTINDKEISFISYSIFDNCVELHFDYDNYKRYLYGQDKLDFEAVVDTPEFGEYLTTLLLSDDEEKRFE